jgi:chemotaxis protein methyltransferase CheR
MIYFDGEVRRRLLQEICRLLRPGGYLMVGHAESLTGMMLDLKVVRPSIYVKP